MIDGILQSKMSKDTNARSHLPNAAHIDRVLAHVKQHPKAWAAAWDAARAAAWDAAWDAAWTAAGDAAWDAAGDTVWDAVWDAAGDAACAVVALIAWDDCAHLLDTDPDQVRVMALLGHHPAVLLLPAAMAMNETSPVSRKTVS